MRSENMAKIALNAVRLPKFEPVNGKSWLPAFGSLVGQPEIGGALSCHRMLAFLFFYKWQGDRGKLPPL